MPCAAAPGSTLSPVIGCGELGDLFGEASDSRQTLLQTLPISEGCYMLVHGGADTLFYNDRSDRTALFFEDAVHKIDVPLKI